MQISSFDLCQVAHKIPLYFNRECFMTSTIASQTANFEKSMLDEDGLVKNLDGVENWCGEVIALIKKRYPKPQKAILWAYRAGGDGGESLSLDILFSGNNVYPITFCIGFEHNYDLDCPHVPDGTEAFHMASLIINRLNIPVKMGFGD